MKFAYLITGLIVHYSLLSAEVRGDLIFYGPSAYLSPADIPAGFYSSAPTIETLEDASLSFGITATGGLILGPGLFTDSVDIDDGVINNLGSGHSYFSSNGSDGVTFTFNHAQLPTAAGLVWTDGLGNVTFEAFGAGMVSLGILGPLSLAEGNHRGSTAEDRFFGVQYNGGIMAIKISDSGGGIEVDHIQFGSAVAVPEPATMLLVCAGMFFLYVKRFRNGIGLHCERWRFAACQRRNSTVQNSSKQNRCLERRGKKRLEHPFQ